MRHNDKNRKFGRTTNQRRALLRGLACNLIKHGRIETTLARAKELRGFVEPMVTKARIGSTASERLITSRLGSVTGAKKLVKEIAPRYAERPGGYTRVIKSRRRLGDQSEMALIEFV